MQKMIEMRKVFVKELLVEILKIKLEEVNQINILDIIEDIVKFFNENKEEEYETC